MAEAVGRPAGSAGGTGSGSAGDGSAGAGSAGAGSFGLGSAGSGSTGFGEGGSPAGASPSTSIFSGSGKLGKRERSSRELVDIAILTGSSITSQKPMACASRADSHVVASIISAIFSAGCPLRRTYAEMTLSRMFSICDTDAFSSARFPHATVVGSWIMI
ncbi:hypothetical protein D3C85_866800 [compost metagenome]